MRGARPPLTGHGAASPAHARRRSSGEPGGRKNYGDNATGPMLIVGVDVGITHLGLAELDTGPDGSDRRVGALALVDIMLYGSDDDPGPVELYDRLDAFARDHDWLFSRADVVAIERRLNRVFISRVERW